MNEDFEQIERWNHLFLAEIEELDGNGLRLLVREGKPAGKPRDMLIAGHVFQDCTPIDVIAESAAFEIVWEHYVAYCVLNESYASQPDDEEVYTGTRVRLYTKSRFRQYISRSTFATNEYPMPMQGLKHF